MPKTATAPADQNTAPTPALSPAEIKAELEHSINELTARRDSLDGAVSKLDPATMGVAIDTLKAQVDTLDKQIAAKTRQLATIEHNARYASVVGPFLDRLDAIELDPSAKGGRLPASLDFASLDEKYAAAMAAVCVIEAIQDAMARTMSNGVPADIWDEMRPMHLILNEAGTHVAVKFAEGKRAASSGSTSTPGSGRGKAQVWKITGLPETDGAGIARVGDEFGPGTRYPRGVDYARTIEPTRYDALIAERERNGGRVSPSNALKALGYTLESREPAAQSAQIEGEVAGAGGDGIAPE